MTEMRTRRLAVQAWLASITLHGVAITLAVLVGSQVKPSTTPPVVWTVSVVETAMEGPAEKTDGSGPAPAPDLHRDGAPQRVETTRTVTGAGQEHAPSRVNARGRTENAPAETSSATAELPQPHQAVADAMPSMKEIHPQYPQEVAHAVDVVDAMVPRQAPDDIPGRHEEPPVLHTHHPVGVDGEQAPPGVSPIPADPEEPAVPSAETPVKDHVANRLLDESMAMQKSVVEADREASRSMPPPSIQSMEALGDVRGRPRPVETPAGELGTLHQLTKPDESLAVARLPTQGANRDNESTAHLPATTPAPGSGARPDYGWLIESLGRRLAEAKRYPGTARLNGWEGKVVLRAIIRADGNLADVTVQTSSGYDELDAAAMEVLRMVCPLPMTQELGRPKVAIRIPVVYALTR